MLLLLVISHRPDVVHRTGIWILPGKWRPIKKMIGSRDAGHFGGQPFPRLISLGKKKHGHVGSNGERDSVDITVVFHKIAHANALQILKQQNSTRGDNELANAKTKNISVAVFWA
jgi:hypothetical protein